VQIFVSGDLDENRIESLLKNGASIDAFGVGTALSTSADAPSIGVIYKLVEVEIGGHLRNTAKFSEAKKTYPGRKQIFRFTDTPGKFSRDVIGLEEEKFPAADRLLIPVMRSGQRLAVSTQDPAATIRAARQRFLTDRAHLPGPILALSKAEPPFPVSYSARLEELCEQIRLSLVKTARD
jgi:nicotinate phosphoribosyltransferase